MRKNHEATVETDTDILMSVACNLCVHCTSSVQVYLHPFTPFLDCSPLQNQTFSKRVKLQTWHKVHSNLRACQSTELQSPFHSLFLQPSSTWDMVNGKTVSVCSSVWYFKSNNFEVVHWIFPEIRLCVSWSRDVCLQVLTPVPKHVRLQQIYSGALLFHRTVVMTRGGVQSAKCVSVWHTWTAFHRMSVSHSAAGGFHLTH